MQIHISELAEQMGFEAASAAEQAIKTAIEEQGSARIVLSTGASQFHFLEQFVRRNIEWHKVEMFHLDEYIDLPETHPASFRKYLRERFLVHVPIKQAWLVNGEGDTPKVLQALKEEIGRAPIDLAMIGIGVNGHIAFNDPPADFDTEEPYRVVNLNDTCKDQQVGEGWFASRDEVPEQAITMTVQQIMKSRRIISVVPHQVKSNAIHDTMMREVDPRYPSTILKRHADWMLFLDKESASQIIR